MGEQNVQGVWDKPNDVWFVCKLIEYKYAKKMMDEGNIKFGCAYKWIKQAENERQQGQGDLYEGTFATCRYYDIPMIISYLKRDYNVEKRDVEVQFDGKLLYFKRKKTIRLPVYCFYTLRYCDFEVPKKEGNQIIKAEIAAKYFKDFTKKPIEELELEERPTFIMIDNVQEFINRIKEKLICMGCEESEILCNFINYDYNFVKHSLNFNCLYKPPRELFVKDSSFKYQNECRIIVNTKNKLLIEKLLNDSISIGPIEDIAQLSGANIEGLRVEIEGEVYKVK